MTQCEDCGAEYGTFPDYILQDDVWKRIAPREDGNGILCPTCIAKRLDKIGLWYQDGYYTHKGWSAFNPFAEQVESLRSENAELLQKAQRLEGEIDAFRADIEAGRLVRVPKVGDMAYMLFDGKILFGEITEISCPWEKSVSFVAKTDEEQECTGTWMLHVFPTEQAARAAMEGDTE